ncbi:MAG: aminotransferase class IV [Ekhidna sp.]
MRVVYEEEGQDVSFSEYKKRIIETLEVVESSPFNYSHKFENRANISLLAESSNADDIIIAFNGEVKDSSYANLAFWNGQEWLTPENPLLEGVRRARLLQEKKIKKATIHISDLGAFEKVSLINAMLDLGDIEIDLK